LPRTDAPLVWDMMWEDLIREYGKRETKWYQVDSPGARVGNWRPTWTGKDQTVKRLKGIEIGIFSMDDRHVEIRLTDERFSKLQIVLPREIADELTRAISERSVFIQNKQNR
jgi:hypothetical protein